MANESARKESALVVGAGRGLSGSLARLLESEGFNVALGARNPDKLETKGLALRRDRPRAGGGRFRSGRAPVGRAGSRRLQRELPHARAVRRARSQGGGKN